MAVWNLVAIPAATYDDATRILTITCTNAAYTGRIPSTITNQEQIEVGLLLAIESANSTKRTDLNAPISNADSLDLPTPQYQFVARTNAAGTTTENQLEYTPNIRLWFKDSGVTASNAVNDND